MVEFLQQLSVGIALLPPYLLFIAIVFVILPTLFAVLLRYSLYRHLQYLGTRVRRLIAGVRQEQQPFIIENLERRFQQASVRLEQINTAALIEGLYSQEQFGFFGFSLRCEPVNYFCRTLPNLLLAFGLLGTFLGITINLANISQTISQVDVNDVGRLVEALDRPLQGMGIAFITSLVAVACSSLLTIVNFIWNTNLAKTNVLNVLEDYLDNVFLPQLPTHNPVKETIERLTSELNSFLSKFGATVEQSIETLAEPIQQVVQNNQQSSQQFEQIYGGFIQSFEKLEKSAVSFHKAANTIEQSGFAEKLSTATTDLAIAQNQFSQSSLVLKRSTQGIEHTLETVQTSVRKVSEVGDELTSLNQKYADITALTQKQIGIEAAVLSEIKLELARLVEKLRDYNDG